MIESRLIGYKHYVPWADEIIASLDTPPPWVLEIATSKYSPDAVAAINGFVYSEPFQEFENVEDEYVACLFLRYRHDAISWATFLEEAGRFTDAYNGRRDCEYFYELLNELEDQELSKALEQRQAVEVEGEFSENLLPVRELYEIFLTYFRRFQESRAASQ